MNTTHEPFTRQMSDRLETTAIGLGLMRLLQDARRFKEAREILDLLQYGNGPVAKDTSAPSPANRIDADELHPHTLSLA